MQPLCGRCYKDAYSSKDHDDSFHLSRVKQCIYCISSVIPWYLPVNIWAHTQRKRKEERKNWQSTINGRPLCLSLMGHTHHLEGTNELRNNSHEVENSINSIISTVSHLNPPNRAGGWGIQSDIDLPHFSTTIYKPIYLCCQVETTDPEKYGESWWFEGNSGTSGYFFYNPTLAWIWLVHPRAQCGTLRHKYRGAVCVLVLGMLVVLEGL